MRSGCTVESRTRARELYWVKIAELEQFPVTLTSVSVPLQPSRLFAGPYSQQGPNHLSPRPSPPPPPRAPPLVSTTT